MEFEGRKGHWRSRPKWVGSSKVRPHPESQGQCNNGHPCKGQGQMGT